MKTKVINKEIPESILEIIKYIKDSSRDYYGCIELDADETDKLCNWFDLLEEKEVEDAASSPYEFQVGDLVEVQGHPSGNNSEYDGIVGFHNNTWVSEMQGYVNGRFTVNEIYSEGVLLNFAGGWSFPPQSLKLIKKAK